MANPEELKKYYNRLENALSLEGASYDYNNDRSHNATVMKLMFNKSDVISMYCGELSIFNSKFAKHDDNSKDIMDDMYSSFRDFLKRKGVQLNIILQNYSKEIFNELECKDEFLTAYKQGKIKISKIDDIYTFKNNIKHFAFSDKKITRIEIDKSKHSAKCSFNDERIYASVNDAFNKLDFISSSLTISDIE